MSGVLTVGSVNPNLEYVSFPWPSKTDIRASEIKKEIKDGVKYPFNEVYTVESANPQGMGVKPLTYIQQVLSLCTNPDLLKSDLFPSDVKKRAKNILDDCFGNLLGSYSLYQGIPCVIKQIAKFLEQRDGVPCDIGTIHVSNGATDGIQFVMEMFGHIKSEKPIGVLVPVPEYPLFKAEIARHGLRGVNYFLDEEKDWSVDLKDLQRAVDESRSTCDVRALVIINPGNPGGNVMTREEIEEIVKFAYKENILIIADEVYQQNIYDSTKTFLSFKKVMYEMGRPYRDMQLASFMSASKGYMGECGVRSGFFEFINIDKKVRDLMEKLLVLRVCPSTYGQAVMYCICNPPEPGEPSYETYRKEKNEFYKTMKLKAEYCNKKFNSVTGLSSALVDCSMFFFPRIHVSKKALREAESRGLKADEMFCLEMVEETGIVTLPGTAFSQKAGTYHFRYTFLFPIKLNNFFVDKIVEFHQKFMKKYAD